MMTSSDPTIQIPRKYKILEEVGRGSLTIVYKAFEPRQERNLALKVLRPQLTVDGPLVKRFLDGARESLKLGHPNIAQIYDVGERDDLYYVAMQYIEGRTLAKKIEQGALSPQETLGIVGQVAAALDYAHERGMYHHYLTPGDIMVDEKGHVSVTDFGLKHALTGTMTGAQPEYMAPEQVRGGPADHRADLYALGAMCYAMLSGRPPFRGDTPAVLHAQVYESPIPLRALNPSLSPDLERVLEIALAKEPQRRYLSGAEFAKALSSACEGGRGDVKEEEEEKEEPTLKMRAPRLRRPAAQRQGRTLWLLAAIPAAFLSGICLVALIWAVVLLSSYLQRPTGLRVSAVSPTSTRAPTFVLKPPATSTRTPTPSPTYTSVPPTPTPTSTATPSPTPTPRPTSTRISTPVSSTVALESSFTFTNLVLARGVSADGEPTSPGTTFSSGSDPVYAFFDYEGMTVGTSWAHVWLRNRVEMDRAEGGWPAEWGDRGVAWVYYSPVGGFTPGDYEVRILVKGSLVASKSFTVK